MTLFALRSGSGRRGPAPRSPRVGMFPRAATRATRVTRSGWNTANGARVPSTREKRCTRIACVARSRPHPVGRYPPWRPPKCRLATRRRGCSCVVDLADEARGRCSRPPEKPPRAVSVCKLISAGLSGPKSPGNGGLGPGRGGCRQSRGIRGHEQLDRERGRRRATRPTLQLAESLCRGSSAIEASCGPAAHVPAEWCRGLGTPCSHLHGGGMIGKFTNEQLNPGY